jgi:hypothetical protein
MIKQHSIPSELDRCLSLDIETLSTSGNAAVVEVGMILFTKDKQFLTILAAEVYNIPARLYSVDTQFRIEASTIDWWHSSSGRDLYNLPNQSSDLTLDQHRSVVDHKLRDEFKAKEYFTRGHFDLPILKNFCYNFDPLAVNYRCHHDIRTLHSIPSIKSATPAPLNNHNALVDAMHNIEIVAAAYNIEIRYEDQCRYLANLCLRTTSAR